MKRMFAIYIAILVAVFLVWLSAPSALERAYQTKLKEARADCAEKAGDEFAPYGLDSWVSVIRLDNPMTFRCRRFLRHWKYSVAVYRFRREADRIEFEVR